MSPPPGIPPPPPRVTAWPITIAQYQSQPLPYRPESSILIRFATSKSHAGEKENAPPSAVSAYIVSRILLLQEWHLRLIEERQQSCDDREVTLPSHTTTNTWGSAESTAPRTAPSSVALNLFQLGMSLVRGALICSYTGAQHDIFATRSSVAFSGTADTAGVADECLPSNMFAAASTNPPEKETGEERKASASAGAGGQADEEGEGVSDSREADATPNTSPSPSATTTPVTEPIAVVVLRATAELAGGSLFSGVIVGMLAHGVGSWSRNELDEACWCLHGVAEALSSSLFTQITLLELSGESSGIGASPRTSCLLENIETLLAVLHFYAREECVVPPVSGGVDSGEGPQRGPYTIQMFYTLFKNSEESRDEAVFSSHLTDVAAWVLNRSVNSLSNWDVSWSLEGDSANMRDLQVVLTMYPPVVVSFLQRIGKLCADYPNFQRCVMAVLPFNASVFKVTQLLNSGVLLSQPTATPPTSLTYSTALWVHPLRCSRLPHSDLAPSSASVPLHVSMLERKQRSAAEEASEQEGRNVCATDLSSRITPKEPHFLRTPPPPALYSAIASGSPATTAETTVTRQFVGLANIGNTCFLNSITQMLFCARGFRLELVTSVADGVLFTPPPAPEAGDETTGTATEPSATRAVTSTSPSSSSTLAHALHTRSAFSILLAEMHWRILYNHQAARIDPHLCVQALPSPFNDRRQHDASEFSKVLLECLESAEQHRSSPPSQEGGAQMVGTTPPNTSAPCTPPASPSGVTRWFSGSAVTVMECMRCGYSRSARNFFWDLSVPLEASECVPPPPPPLVPSLTASESSDLMLEVHVDAAHGVEAVTTYRQPSHESSRRASSRSSSGGTTATAPMITTPTLRSSVPLQSLLLRVADPTINREVLDGDNRLECERCGTRTPTALSMSVAAAATSPARGRTADEVKGVPEYLTLQLNRFRYNRLAAAYEKVDYPVELNEYIVLPVAVGDEEEGERGVSSAGTAYLPYRICAVVVHSGSNPQSGHYFTLARAPDDDDGDGVTSAVDVTTSNLNDHMIDYVEAVTAIVAGRSPAPLGSVVRTAVSPNYYAGWVALNDSTVAEVSEETMGRVLAGSAGVYGSLETPYVVLYERVRGRGGCTARGTTVQFSESMSEVFSARVHSRAATATGEAATASSPPVAAKSKTPLWSPLGIRIESSSDDCFLQSVHHNPFGGMNPFGPTDPF